jgi:hypothetical protein
MKPPSWWTVGAFIVLSFMAGTLYEYLLWENVPLDPVAYDAGYSSGYDKGYYDAAAYEPWFTHMCLGDGGFATCIMTPIAVLVTTLGIGFVWGYVSKGPKNRGQ